MTGVSIIGIGYRQHKRGTAPLPERGELVHAIIAGCEDAGYDPADIDGFVSYGDDRNEPARLMPDLGTRRLRWSSMVWGGGGGGSAAALGQAAAAINAGQARAVVVFRALVQDSSGRLSAAVMAHHTTDHMLAAGIVSPAQICALRAQRLYHFHPELRDAAEALMRASYYHAARTPGATAEGAELDVETARSSRFIAEPFRLYDCSRENDGAGALLLVSDSDARTLRQHPVRLAGVAQGAACGWGDLLENDDPAVYATAGFRAVADELWRATGLTPKNIDAVQLYENFSAQGVMALIDHGFCSIENAPEVLRFENLTAPSGRVPVNTAGGNLAGGFVHGIGLAIEAVRLLRGDSANPVPGARTCLVTGGPGAPIVSSAVLSVG